MKWGIAILAIILVGSGVYVYLGSRSSEPAFTTELASRSGPVDRVREVRVPPRGMKLYESELYRFSIFYPESLSVHETFDGNAATITFQNVEEAKGFQIFATPYLEPQITKERFIKDIPSGVRKNEESFVIDGASGVAFYSEDASLGETREVWFLNEGYLYEVTTIKVLEADLLPILETWRFF